VSLAQKITEIKNTGSLNDGEVATAAGVAPATVRMITRTGVDPHLTRVRRRLEQFCEINSSARSRSDLRFV